MNSGFGGAYGLGGGSVVHHAAQHRHHSQGTARRVVIIVVIVIVIALVSALETCIAIDTTDNSYLGAANRTVHGRGWVVFATAAQGCVVGAEAAAGAAIALLLLRSFRNEFREANSEVQNGMAAGVEHGSLAHSEKWYVSNDLVLYGDQRHRRLPLTMTTR